MSAILNSKILTAWACFFMVTAAWLLVLPLAQTAHSEKIQEEMTADLDAVLLEDFILFVSRVTDRNIVFREDQIPETKVTLHTRQPMSEPELMAVFENILASNDLELVSKGGVMYVLRAPVVQSMRDPFSFPPLEGEKYELLTTVIQLEPRVPVEEAAELLQPFVSDYGQVLGIPPARAVLVRDTRQNIEKMSDIISTVQELGPKWETEMLYLKDAVAEEAASKVIEFYEGLIERGQMGEMPVVLPVEWSNALIVAGAPDQIEAVKGLVQNLDEIKERETGLKIYALKNAKAESVAEVLQDLLAGEIDERAEAVENMVVSPDKATNSVLVMVDPQLLTRVDEIIEHLDQPLAQVYVEALIMETTLEHSQRFGVEWLAGVGGSDGVVTGGFLDPDTQLGPLLSDPAPPVAPGGLSVGALGNVITYAGQEFSTLGALVNFIKTATDFNIISTPQIMTLNNAEAEVFVGEERPFRVHERIDPEGNVIQSFDYREVGIRLLVTPTINTETGMIRLAVEQEVQNVIGQIAQDAPTTMSRDTRTNVQLPSGSTMVISGLVESEYTHTREAVPGLAKVPGLGWMFRREHISAPKTTLMVFLTARIIESVEHADELTRDRMDRVHEARREQEEILKREFWGRSQRQEEAFGIQMPETDAMMEDAVE